jgi:hypothetical protein
MFDNHDDHTHENGKTSHDLHDLLVKLPQSLTPSVTLSKTKMISSPGQKLAAGGTGNGTLASDLADIDTREKTKSFRAYSHA